MITCREVTRLISEGHDRRLSLSERIGVRLHLMMCNGCRNFDAQLRLIRKACQRLANGEAPLDPRER